MMALTACALFGHPMPQHLNALTIATNQAIANTGATSIFIMEGTDVDNKHPATSPLTINLPDGKQIRSTHVCNIQIHGLPTMLLGHIVPSLSIASLIGIRLLCQAGCKVIFDDRKCDVVFNGVVILCGYKDLSTDLWTLPNPTKKARNSNLENDAGSCNGRAPQSARISNLENDADTRDPGTTLATFTHSVKTRANAVKFAHQSLCNPKISTLLKAVRRGFLKGCPNLSERLILKYLNPSTAAAKGHMKHPRHGIRSTHPKQKMELTPVPQIAPPVLPLFVPNVIQDVHTGPNIIADDGDESIANIFLFWSICQQDKRCCIP